MFAVLSIEREPLQLQGLPTAVISWLQDVGLLAAFGLLIFVVLLQFRLLGPRKDDGPAWQGIVFRIGLLGALVCYGPALIVMLFDLWNATAPLVGLTPAGPSAEARIEGLRRLRGYSLTYGGAFALLTAGLPFLINLGSLRIRRIWALSKLSFKEAIRRRILYAFTGLMVLFLFASWFIPHKPEDQVRSYVGVIYWAMSPLLLFAGALVAAFSIPADIKQQTIHTIVTKPVERFEIVLGRFFGFTALMTLILAAITAVSLVYVLRGVDPDAAAESLKAREPLYGELTYENTQNEKKASNVGREWDYRSYITASGTKGAAAETAVFSLPAVPASVAARPKVRCEFGFDVYRTTKGEENRGISCDFVFRTPAASANAKQEFLDYRAAARRQPNPLPDDQIDDAAAEKTGYYEVLSKEVIDYHTQSVDVPGGLLRSALQATATKVAPPLLVRITCNSQTQYVGMAKHDLYLRLDEESANQTARFAVNFFKGACGLWLRLVLVIGLAVALSTYLSGVISLLIALMFYVGGLAQEFIATVAKGSNIGGGPVEALFRLVRADNIIAPLDETAANKFAQITDVGWRFLIRRLLDIIPDVDRFDMTQYVAEGFNVPLDQLGLSFLLLIGYLLPWGVLAFYLIKWREIASPT